MTQTLVQKSVLDSSGNEIPMPFFQESVTGSNFPAVQSVPGELGGCSVYFNPLATVAAVNIKNLPGMIYGFALFHITYTVPVFVGFYNQTTAPTIGTSVLCEFGVPYSGTGANGSGGTPVWFPQGIACSAGIGVGMHVGGITGTTAVTANQQLLVVFYK